MTIAGGKRMRLGHRKAGGVYKNDGFTLVELMAVVVILGILAAVAVPAVASSVREARGHAAEAGKAQIEALLNQFYLEEEQYPETLQELVDEGYTVEIPLTGTGKKYLYQRRSPDEYSLELPE